MDTTLQPEAAVPSIAKPCPASLALKPSYERQKSRPSPVHVSNNFVPNSQVQRLFSSASGTYADSIGCLAPLPFSDVGAARLSTGCLLDGSKCPSQPCSPHIVDCSVGGAASPSWASVLQPSTPAPSSPWPARLSSNGSCASPQLILDDYHRAGTLNFASTSVPPSTTPVRASRLSHVAKGPALAPAQQGAQPAASHEQLSPEDKEWLFGTAGIAKLPMLRLLGDGGTARVELVRLDLPGGRCLKLARKVTKPAAQIHAQSAAHAHGRPKGQAAGQSAAGSCVYYAYPFSAFDREVRAMRDMQASGLAVPFHAATFDHEAGCGYILMSVAPHKSLEELVARLSRLHRQRKHAAGSILARFFCMGPGAAARPAPKALPPPPSQPQPQSAPATPRPQALSEATPRTASSISCTISSSSCTAPRPSNVSVSACPGMDTPPGSSPSNHHHRHAPHLDAPPAAKGGGLLMDVEALRYYGAVVLQALAHLHAAGYVHRDVKLANVLLMPGGRARLSDFGAAASAIPGREGFFSGPTAGTELYLAPELAAAYALQRACRSGDRADDGACHANVAFEASSQSDELEALASAGVCTPAVDAYGAALLLVELATGWKPEALWARVVAPVRHGHAPRLPSELPEELHELLLGALVRDPTARCGVAQMLGHRFFRGLDLARLAEARGPHAALLERPDDDEE